MVRERNPARPAFRGLAAGLVILAGLAACTRTDGSALPLAAPTITASEAAAGPRQELRVVSETGDTIALTQWTPEAAAPTAVILAVHGYGDYGSSTFAAAAEEWAEAGIITYAYDQRGFGRNPSNSDWPGHDALVADLGAVWALVKGRHPDMPMTVLGHSMGGAVVTAAVGEDKIDPDRVILLAPALWGGAYLNPFLRTMAHAANTFAPNKRWTGDGIVTIQASDNIKMLRGLGRDPLYVRNPSSREFVGLIKVMDRAVDAAPQVETPILVVYGEKDEVVPEEPILAAFEQFTGEKEYRSVETGWHMLLRDLEGKTVRDLVAGFVLEGGS